MYMKYYPVHIKNMGKSDACNTKYQISISKHTLKKKKNNKKKSTVQDIKTLPSRF